MLAPKSEVPYGFDPIFEKQVVTLACSNPDFFASVGQYLDPELLKTDPAKHAVRAARAIYKDIGHGPSASVHVIQRLRGWMDDGKVTLEMIKEVAELFDTVEDAGMPDVEGVMAELAPLIRQRIRDEALQAAIESFGRKGDLSRAVALEEKAVRVGKPPAKQALPMRQLSTVKLESVAWLWRGRVPLGKLSLVDGDPGLGKSTMLSADIAARVSTGTAMPGEEGSVRNPAADVIILSAEDGASDTIRPRLEAADGDATRVHVVDPGALIIPDDIARLEAMIVNCKAALIIVDPLMAYLSGRIDSHRDQDVRRAMTLLSEMAGRTGAAVVLVRHLNKRTDSAAVYRGGGSIGIIGSARSGLLVAKDPEQDAVRILASVKSNLGPPPASLMFRLENDPAHGCGRVIWLGESPLTADALVGTPAKEDGEVRTAIDSAVDVLGEILRDGPVEAERVKGEAKNAGVAAATLRRAQSRLGVRSSKNGLGSWVWSMPLVPNEGLAHRGVDEHLHSENRAKTANAKQSSEGAQREAGDVSTFENGEGAGVLPGNVAEDAHRPEDAHRDRAGPNPDGAS